MKKLVSKKFKMVRGSEFEKWMLRKKKNAEYLARLDEMMEEEEIF